uniref:Uncharacterized protein n=1 Tax=Enterovibrio norvegicus TaxID=188144 RepID=A0A0H4A4Z8_9GAMM|nr:hypothetical protein [Enterovibrio norvegicus]
MSNHTYKFPSGRSVKRLKQDAKSLAKKKCIPLNVALDEIAKLNGSEYSWSRSLSQLDPSSLTSKQSNLATELGITDEELSLLTWDIQDNSSNDGLVYDYVLTFDSHCPTEVLDKIGLDDELSIRVSANAFDEEEHYEEPEPYIPQRFDMNPYRKLIVLGLNAILTKNLVDLEWDGNERDKTSGYIEIDIAGENSIVSWSQISYGEIRVSVWWKYDHNLHPQANLTGWSKESFSCGTPVAKRQHYKKFVGVVCSAWLERLNGKYLQGHGKNYLFDLYTRKGELEQLVEMPNPTPLGYEAEGPKH